VQLADARGRSGGVEGLIASCAPPRRFRSAEGVTRAQAEMSGPFVAPSLRGRSAAQKAGIRYERKVVAELSAEFGKEFSPSLWFKFDDRHATGRWCQVDGLRKTEISLTIFEVKSRFISDAGYQLRHLYLPVVRCAFPNLPIHLVVICKSFDPWTAFPEAYSLIPSLNESKPDLISVFPWRL